MENHDIKKELKELDAYRKLGTIEEIKIKMEELENVKKRMNYLSNEIRELLAIAKTLK